MQGKASIRRSRIVLEAAVAAATSPADRAKACLELGVFHDNNSREADAIPQYELALAAGLSGESRAECLAWLASSLYKTGHPETALQRLDNARELTNNSELVSFLFNLEHRIRLKMAREAGARR